MLKLYLLIFLTGVFQAKCVNVIDICNNAGRTLLEADKTFYLTSENYGGNQYSNGLSCGFEMQTPDVPLILSLEYLNFDVEYENRCIYDSLCVNGVKFCGSQNGTFEYLVPEFSNFTATFKTDHSVRTSGFQISVSTRPARNEIITQVVGGVGSGDPSLLVTTQVTYTPDYASNYTDRCETTGGATPTPYPTSWYDYYYYHDHSTNYPPYPLSTSTTPTSDQMDNDNPTLNYDTDTIRQIRELLIDAESKINAAKSLLWLRL